jgi:hypothetical protein
MHPIFKDIYVPLPLIESETKPPEVQDKPNSGLKDQLINFMELKTPTSDIAKPPVR